MIAIALQLLTDKLSACIVTRSGSSLALSHLPDYAPLDIQHIFLECQLKPNLPVLLFAHFRLYDRAMRIPPLVHTFFQSHPNFTVTAYPLRTGAIQVVA